MVQIVDVSYDPRNLTQEVRAFMNLARKIIFTPGMTAVQCISTQ